MKSILILCAAVLLASCTVTKQAVVTYSHNNGAIKVNDSLQDPTQFDVFNHTDDELTLVFYDYDILDVKPIVYNFENKTYYQAGHAYFYSPDMSEYMMHNDFFIFLITYKKHVQK